MNKEHGYYILVVAFVIVFVSFLHNTHVQTNAAVDIFAGYDKLKDATHINTDYESVPDRILLQTDATGKYMTEGVSTFGIDMGVNSRFRSMTIKASSNPITSPLTVEYRVAKDRGSVGREVWQVAKNNGETFFPVNTLGAYIEIQFTLRSTDGTDTPIIREFSLDYKNEIKNRKFIVQYEPKNKTIKLDPNRGVILTWAKSMMDGYVKNFVILRGVDSHPVDGQPYAVLPNTALQFIDTDIKPGHTYKYLIRSRGDYNQSDGNRHYLAIAIADRRVKYVVNPAFYFRNYLEKGRKTMLGFKPNKNFVDFQNLKAATSRQRDAR